MIRHTVAFRLKHAAGSPAERDFLAAARRLADIPEVAEFLEIDYMPLADDSNP